MFIENYLAIYLGDKSVVFNFETFLRITHTEEFLTRSEFGETWGFLGFCSSEERLIRSIKAQRNLLKNLTINFSKDWICNFQISKFCLLFFSTSFNTQFIVFDTLIKEIVIQP